MWGLITNFWGFFFSRFAALGHVLIYRVAAALGIGIGVYALALPAMVDFVQQYLNAMPPWAIELLGALHIDSGLTMLFSAYAAKLGVRVRAIKLEQPPQP